MSNIVPLHRNVVHIPSREEAELVDQYEWLLRGGYGDCADAHRRSRASHRALFHGIGQRLQSTIAFRSETLDGIFYALLGAMAATVLGLLVLWCQS